MNIPTMQTYASLFVQVNTNIYIYTYLYKSWGLQRSYHLSSTASVEVRVGLATDNVQILCLSGTTRWPGG